MTDKKYVEEEKNKFCWVNKMLLSGSSEVDGFCLIAAGFVFKLYGF